MLDQRRSFSFSSFDFNSSNNSARVLFSSSDDEFFASNFIMYDTEEEKEEDDEAYIEINLDPSRPTQTTMLVDDGDGMKRNFHTEETKFNSNSYSSEVELGISFSSSTGILPIETTTCGTTQHAQGTTTTSTRMTKKRRGRPRLFVSLARIVNEFIGASSAKKSNSVRAIEANNNNNVACQHGPVPLSKSNCTEMIRTRKDCTMVTSKNNGIMNFIVKLKYKNIPSMLISMVKPKAKRGQPLLQKGSKDPKYNDNMKLKTRNHSDLDHQHLNRDKSTSSSSVAGIVNFKAMRGVLDALIVKTSRYYTSATTGGELLYANKKNKSKSCPSSIKSSPMHNNNVYDDDVRRFYSRDNSVQAAIAHCKKSFGTQAEFDFHI